MPQRPSLNLYDLERDIKGSTGWFVGPTAKFILPVIGLGIEANALYSQENIKIEGQNVMSQSIDIPLYLRYELHMFLEEYFIVPFVAIGPQFSWNIGHRSITLENFGNIAGSEYRIKDSNISLNLGLGLVVFDQLQIHANYKLALGKTADITGTILNFSEEITELKTNTWQLSLAYFF